MTQLTFSPYKDAGSPTLTKVDGIMTTAYKAGERGRWLSNYVDAAAGEQHTLTGEYRVSDGAAVQIAVVFWKADDPRQYLSTASLPPYTDPQEDFAAFSLPFTVPNGAGRYRVEARSWTGSGVGESRNLLIDAEQPDPEPDPDPTPDPNWPQRELTGFVRGRMATIQDVSDPTAELPEWECLPLTGMAWGDNIYLTIVRPEPDPEPEPEE